MVLLFLFGFSLENRIYKKPEKGKEKDIPC